MLCGERMVRMNTQGERPLFGWNKPSCGAVLVRRTVKRGQKEELTATHSLSLFSPQLCDVNAQQGWGLSRRPLTLAPNYMPPAPKKGLNGPPGYIRIWRKLDESWISHDMQLLGFAVKLLLRARYRNGGSVLFGGKQVPLNRGQFVCGIRDLAKSCNVSFGFVQRAMVKLEKHEFLIRQVNHEGSIVTICNWDTYQNTDDESESQSESPANHHRITTESPPIPSEECNKGRREEGKNTHTEARARFDTFLAAYPKKVKKFEALEEWRKLMPDEAMLVTMLKTLDWQKRSDEWTRGFIPGPDKWLEGRRWEDEPGTSKHDAFRASLTPVPPGEAAHG